MPRDLDWLAVEFDDSVVADGEVAGSVAFSDRGPYTGYEEAFAYELMDVKGQVRLDHTVEGDVAGVLIVA